MIKSKLVSTKEFIEILNNLSPDYQVRVYYGNEGRHNPMSNHNKEKMTLTKLAEQMNTRFDNLEKDVNARIDRIDARLDYIVKVNNLKDSK
ncbi:MAG: hypothetical protein MJ214_03545 [Bacilli bacterium]|nr:hypothetical protein [Bacilli bacterium]MCQ2795260.1 hypothetical protein [Bacilli bacterium]